MSRFPKHPRGSVRGGLTLVIVPPSVDVVVGNGASEDGADDSVLDFDVPVGFSMDSSAVDLVDRQFSTVFSLINELGEKAKDCVSCERITSVDSLDTALFITQRLQYTVSDMDITGRFSVYMGQEPSGVLVISTIVGEKQCDIQIDGIDCVVGMYHSGNLVSEVLSGGVSRFDEVIQFLRG